MELLKADRYNSIEGRIWGIDNNTPKNEKLRAKTIYYEVFGDGQ